MYKKILLYIWKIDLYAFEKKYFNDLLLSTFNQLVFKKYFKYLLPNRASNSDITCKKAICYASFLIQMQTKWLLHCKLIIFGIFYNEGLFMFIFIFFKVISKRNNFIFNININLEFYK